MSPRWRARRLCKRPKSDERRPKGIEDVGILTTSRDRVDPINRCGITHDSFDRREPSLVTAEYPRLSCNILMSSIRSIQLPLLRVEPRAR
jgi:hypothetical protein